MEDKKEQLIRQKMAELWKKEGIIRSELLVEAFIKAPRRSFIPEKYGGIAYLDQDIMLDSESVMLNASKVIKVLEEASLEKGNHVLQIGSSTGYEEALISMMGMKLDVLEPRIENIQRASANIAAACKSMEAPQYHRRLRDISTNYDRVVCFSTISTMDKKIVELVENGIMVLSVGEKHLLMRMEMKGDNNPILQFHGSIWMPLMDDTIFS